VELVDNYVHESVAICSRSGTTAGSAGSLLEWTLLNSLVLRNEEGMRTRRGHANQRDSIIDLTFFDHFSTEDAVFSAYQVSEDEDYTLGSDHNAIAWAVDFNSEFEPEDIPLGYKIDPERKQEWIDAFMGGIDPTSCFFDGGPEPLADLSSTEGIKREVDKLMNAMSAATEQVMPVRRSQAPVQAPWWNEECADNLRRLGEAPHMFKTPLRDRFRRTIRRAKRTWGDTVLEGAKPEDVWRLVDWTRGKRRKKTPPILGPNGMAVEAEDKCHAFAYTFFPDHHAHVNPVQPDDPEPRERRQHHPLTREEMLSALSGTSNTSAPGVSGSNYRLLKWAVEAAPERFRRMYNACMALGFHPT
jgi:hypothetical protein